MKERYISDDADILLIIKSKVFFIPSEEFELVIFLLKSKNFSNNNENQTSEYTIDFNGRQTGNTREEPGRVPEDNRGLWGLEGIWIRRSNMTWRPKESERPEEIAAVGCKIRAMSE